MAFENRVVAAVEIVCGMFKGRLRHLMEGFYFIFPVVHIAFLHASHISVAHDIVPFAECGTCMMVHIHVVFIILNAETCAQGDGVVFLHLAEMDLAVLEIEELAKAFGQAFDKVVITVPILHCIRHRDFVSGIRLKIHEVDDVIFAGIRIELVWLGRRMHKNIIDIFLQRSIGAAGASRKLLESSIGGIGNTMHHHRVFHSGALHLDVLDVAFEEIIHLILHIVALLVLAVGRQRALHQGTQKLFPQLELNVVLGKRHIALAECEFETVWLQEPFGQFEGEECVSFKFLSVDFKCRYVL